MLYLKKKARKGFLFSLKMQDISINLNEKEEKLSLLMLTNPEGKVLSFHSDLPELKVYLEEMLEKNWIEVLIPSKMQKEIQHILQEMEVKKMPLVSMHTNILLPEGKEIPFLIRIFSLFRENMLREFLVIGKKITEDLAYQKRLENLIMDISTSLVSARTTKIGNLIETALKEIGEFVGVDRTYVFLVDEEMTKAHCLYEWCREGILPQKERLREVNAEEFPWLREKLGFRKEIVCVNSIEELPFDAEKEKREFIEEGIRSILLVPMICNEKIVGFMGFDSVEKERVWNEECIVLLKIFGQIIVNALIRGKIEFELEERRCFLSSIFESIQDGISILDRDLNIVGVNPTMEKWYAHSMPLVGKKCYVAYHCRREPCLVCPTLRTLKTQNCAYEVVPKTGPEGKVVGWIDLYTFPLFDSSTGEMKGVIEYVRDATDRKKAEEILHKVTTNLKKTNRKLRQLILKDSHTGLYNYRYLMEIIEPEFERSKRYGLSLSVIMLDIDYFKSINDVYGHNFGDTVLKQLANICKKAVRIYDTVIRYGGEEFLFILPNTDHWGAINLSRRLLEKINKTNFGTSQQKIQLKVSMGIASYPHDKVYKGIELINIADKLLGKIKEHGGNNIFWSGELESTLEIKEEFYKDKDARLLKEKITKLTQRANQSIREAIYAFARTIKLKDNYTGEHVEKTVLYAVETAKALGLSSEEIEKIRDAAMLHDLGKIGISEKILLKRKKLNFQEFEEIKKHPQIGVDILRSIHFLQGIIPYIFYHHERYDGKGYPSGLKGEEIPLGARIIAIADVYQALTSDRPYRKAYNKKEALRIINEGAGTQFDPQIVKTFLEVVQRIR